MLVLTRQGFVEAAGGSNGFVCRVARAFHGSLTDIPSWSNPRVRAPHCLNPAAVRSVLPAMKRRAELVMTGSSPAAVVAGVRRGYASHEFPAPEAWPMAYMMSHQQYLLDNDPHWKPHVMLFYGGGRQGREWGGGRVPSPGNRGPTRR